MKTKYSKKWGKKFYDLKEIKVTLVTQYSTNEGNEWQVYSWVHVKIKKP
jgi:hypothetical protein